MPATPRYETARERERNALLQTRWEHSTWPNQSITLVGRRCTTAVQQHTISQSIGRKHMVTNQWPPEDARFSPTPPVHGWWLHNHTSLSLSFLLLSLSPSAEECDELSNSPFFHAPTADLATSADDSPQANPRSLTCAWDSRLWSEPMLCIENAVEKQEGGAYFSVPGWISHHLSHIKGSAASWYQMPSNC